MINPMQDNNEYKNYGGNNMDVNMDGNLDMNGHMAKQQENMNMLGGGDQYAVDQEDNMNNYMDADKLNYQRQPSVVEQFGQSHQNPF